MAKLRCFKIAFKKLGFFCYAKNKKYISGYLEKNGKPFIVPLEKLKEKNWAFAVQAFFKNEIFLSRLKNGETLLPKGAFFWFATWWAKKIKKVDP